MMHSIRELKEDMVVMGLVPGARCTIIRIKPQGETSIKVTYEVGDDTQSTVLTDVQMSQIEEVKGNGALWDFSADGALYRLMSEAMRIKNASQFDPYMAVYTSRIQPLPHQIEAVYETMLPRHPLRFLLADDPGAGKTIMAGLYIKELYLREDVKRCMIVAPGSLTEQWQEELQSKFNLDFSLITDDNIKQACNCGRNLLNQKTMDLCIARLDKLKNPKGDLNRWIRKANSYDLIICDEAHKMSARWDKDSVKGSQRFNLGRILSQKTKHFLLMTATPHNGKDDEFELFLSLIDSERFAEIKPKYYQCMENRYTNDNDDDLEEEDDDDFDDEVDDDFDDEVDDDFDDELNEEITFEGPQNTLYSEHRRFTQTIREEDVHDVMRRRVKEDLKTFEGKPLFPERFAYTLSYNLSPDELTLYTSVTEYVRKEYNRAERVAGKKKNTVGFALTILQRRLASSPAAIYSSLRRRKEKLSSQLQELKYKQRTEFDLTLQAEGNNWDSQWDGDNLSADEAETSEELLVDGASAATSLDELQNEINTLSNLETTAKHVCDSRKDRKWEEVCKLLQNNKHMFDNGNREKIIIFTEHRDTLNYLLKRVSDIIGVNAIVTIHGGTPHNERHKAEQEFKNNPDVIVLIATDAAGEGINLQRAHLMINYDLPWNPNRLEQRFGRIHRIGQKKTCFMWNLVAEQTREGEVYKRLLDKLETVRTRLGGKVFDVLGKIKFDNKSLRDMMIDAIRYGDKPEAKEYMERVIDKQLDIDNLKRLLEKNALIRDLYDPAKLQHTREEIERNSAKRLQPHFIENFFLNAFKSLGGEIKKQGKRYEIKRVPDEFNQFAHENGIELSSKYKAICFTLDDIETENDIEAELVCPGNSLFNTTIDKLCEKYSDIFETGTIFIDDESLDGEPRLLFYVQTEILNGKGISIHKQTHYILVDCHHQLHQAGTAPYLDYRIPTKDELKQIYDSNQTISWLDGMNEDSVCGFVNDKIYKYLYNDIASQYVNSIDRRKNAIQERLSISINYYNERRTHWETQYNRAHKRKNKEQLTKCTKRVEELKSRLDNCMEELDIEKQCRMVPVKIKGYALVISGRLLKSLMGNPIPSADIEARRAIELAGMHAVMDIERKLGNKPVDVSAENRGYDIESRIPNGPDHLLRFIEVKARRKDADSIIVTKNEILTARNAGVQYILAVVSIDGKQTQTTYYTDLLFKDPDDAMRKIEYSIRDLDKMGKKQVMR